MLNNIAEVKNIFGDKCFDLGNNKYLINKHGKYSPNVTFIISR